MNLGKHILVLVAFMFFMMPGIHAAAHHGHDHGHADGAELCALPVHSCSCHACEPSPCTDGLKIPQEHSVANGIIAAQAHTFTLFTLTEKKQALRHIPASAPGPLAALRTVQLLI